MKDLAEALGKEPVTIYKICSGERRFSGDVDDLAERIGANAKELKSLRRDRDPIADTLRQARQNSSNAKDLERRAELLLGDDRDRREDLLRAQGQIVEDFMDPFLLDAVRVDGLGHGLEQILRTQPGTVQSEQDSLGTDERIFAAAMGQMAEAVGGAAGGAALGAAGGAAVGGTAALAFFAGAAAFGTASTGVAISGLTGAAATSATLAALGGGSLAVGGAGIAGGTLLLTTVVAAPLVLGIGVGALLADRRAYRKMLQEAETIDMADVELRRLERQLRQRWKWARTQTLLLDQIHRTAVPRVARIHMHMPAVQRERIQWQELDPVHEDFRLLLRLITLASNLIAMPTWDTTDDPLEKEFIGQTNEKYEQLSLAVESAPSDRP